MSDATTRIIQRLREDELYFFKLHGPRETHTEEQLVEICDCLLARPDAVKHLWLAGDRLPDDLGVKLAQYISTTTNLSWLDLEFNYISNASRLAIAAALRVNTSLECLELSRNQDMNKASIDAAFVEALRVNPNRPYRSQWRLYGQSYGDYMRLKAVADELGHPTLQMLLAHS